MGKVAVDMTRMGRGQQLKVLEQLREHLGRVAEAPSLSGARRQELDPAVD